MAKVPNFHRTGSLPQVLDLKQIVLVLNSSPCSCKTQAAVIPRLMNTTLRVVSLPVSNRRRHVSILSGQIPNDTNPAVLFFTAATKHSAHLDMADVHLSSSNFN